MKTATKYVTFHLGKVYHIACLNVNKYGHDETLCSKPLYSRDGVRVSATYHNGLPTPEIFNQAPSDLPLCKQCARKLAEAS